MTARLVDTNVIVRHLTQDNAKHAAVADKLFAASDRGELMLIVLPEVLAECVFGLASFYKQPRGLIGRARGPFIGSPGIRISDLDVHQDALRRYPRTRLHFVDCVIAAGAASAGLPVATFDNGLGKLREVQVALDV